MVIKGVSMIELNKVQPKTLSEIVESPYNKFIVKFGAGWCGPCRNFKTFIQKTSFTPRINTAIYSIQLDDKDQKDAADGLRQFFAFKSIPYCVVTDKSFKIIDSLSGFSEAEFMKMFNKHFC
ncbi:uncharacterized protein VICG_02065 [Vittaforma corneae ATCC 50505]|uniref:Thioredoxin domain-containing protein n=1 Tax=Vittaforma corneae (strain ATCC 50505) TaxID=993615 RepID=L2GK42_VITCO|nr:uncharacterized protein VICG_02065 [Vittaforma corneae ATCC 50505]ELA40885.1 hypothetical protein VICG_02065 [Vittaforma corneae ATCC 50505]